MVAPVVVVLDEGPDLRLQITRQVVVLQQDAVLQGLVPALDLPLAPSQPEACRASVSVSVTSLAFIVVHSFQAMT